MACSPILSRIDCCMQYHGAPNCTIQKLKRVLQNSAARIILRAPGQSHASLLLSKLHWLPVQQRVDCNVALLTSKVRSTSTPSYLHHLLQQREDVHTCNVDFSLPHCADHSPRRQLQSLLSAAQHRLSGTRCQKQFLAVAL